MSGRIPRSVVHYSALDPERARGGVETFGRNLALIFERVLFMTPASRDIERVVAERLPVVCDNQHVLDWADEVKVIGFQHGVAWRKARITRRLSDVRMALAQRRAAKRSNVVWAACARWISEEFARLHGNVASRVIYHPVNLQEFDGQLQNEGSRLVLHDARAEHKGQRQIELLAKALPAYRFEPLDCAPHEVASRMRGALAFLHLSRYEGNSIVCNEAMAMNLPCFFTRVGLMLDRDQNFDVKLIEPEVAFKNESRLLDLVTRFLREAEAGPFQPRNWVERHASLAQARMGWRELLRAFDELSPRPARAASRARP